MNTDKTRIVIIDDEEDLCFLLGNMLVSHGFAVNSYYTLKSGLEGIEEFNPDWIIIDNDLPDGRGWEKTNNILAKLPEAHIIKISANPDSERTHHQRNVHYLIKPIHVNSITDLIRENSLQS